MRNQIYAQLKELYEKFGKVYFFSNPKGERPYIEIYLSSQVLTDIIEGGKTIYTAEIMYYPKEKEIEKLNILIDKIFEETRRLPTIKDLKLEIDFVENLSVYLTFSIFVI